MLCIHNSLTRSKETFTPQVAGHVRMYVCGVTVYDYCHVGHGRMMVVFDVVARWLRASGYALTYVRNITDIDDKIIRRAVEQDVTIGELTQRYIGAMHEDLAALGVLPPDHEPRATQFVPQMLNLIEQLEQGGLAYRARDGDVNYAVRRFATYGKLSGKTLDELRAGERVSVADAKHDPLDFVLWKAAKPDEPAQAQWPSPFGPGRPGWHIECSAMATSLLGPHLDIHGGGADLQFPHHENEIAQSEGVHGAPFARYWMHNGFVRIDDQKMSKSLGNFFTLRDVFQEVDPEVLRFLILRTHYRSAIQYSDAHLEDARVSLLRLYTALSAQEPTEVPVLDWDHPVAQRFKQAMDDDFNTPVAVAILFELATDLNRARDPMLENRLRGLAAMLGILGQARATVLRSALRGAAHVSQALDEAQIADLVAQRAQAKAERRWEQADAIRAALLAQGVVLEDGPSGTQWRRA